MIAPSPTTHSVESIPLSPKEKKSYQGRVHDIAIHRPKQPQQIHLQPPPHPPQPIIFPQQQTIIRLPYPNSTHHATYWSEADTAILIQLHRKYYPSVEEESVDKEEGAWTRLTQEFNQITHEKHSTSHLHHQWLQLMAKYNAERAHLMLQQRQAASLQPQPFHIPSYWSHFQYMDLYLHHLPVPEDALNPPTQARKRPRTTEDMHSLLETQCRLMEHTIVEQNQQLKQQVEQMSKLNDKYMRLCETMVNKSQAKEDRYMALMDKLIERQ
ncbi:hypothetical protein BD560DRAFT_395499 [Blakeslea trispora]|nr:hypothetical protein BD560DRAFT_395499 [Blakeslea trispora]